jgi:Domain of unknown function (DUF4184)
VPFTLSHPAAVLPLLRSPLLPSALVAGSVAPDLPSYLPLPVHPAQTHALPAAAGTDLVLGVALLVVFHLLLRAPLVALAPEGLRRRLPDQLRLGRLAIAIPTVVASVALGAATHLAWDAFTQVDGAAVQAIPLLWTTVVGPHRLFNVVGYVSSAGGLAALGWWTHRWYRRTPPTQTSPPGLASFARRCVLTGMAIAATLGASIAATRPQAQVSGYDQVRALLLGAGSVAALAVGCYAVAWQALRRAAHRRPRSRAT